MVCEVPTRNFTNAVETVSIKLSTVDADNPYECLTYLSVEEDSSTLKAAAMPAALPWPPKCPL